MVIASAPATDTPRMLDGPHLAAALRAGIYRLFEQTDHLNKINVFPVPDGDTGTNLSMTLSAVLATLEGGPDHHVGALLARVADAALDGARGNSGAIFSQFLLGLADGTSERTTLDAGTLVHAATLGARYARDAVGEPKEGTLVSVLREFATALQAAHSDARPESIATLLRASLPRVQAALESTASVLEPLRAAQVVDAGAQGFVTWLEGLLAYLETGETGDTSLAPTHYAHAESMADTHGVSTPQPGDATEPRWCTECLVRVPGGGRELDLRQLRERLAPLGSSLVVGGNKQKARIHLHTDDPDRMFALASSFGELTGQKADDMRRQALSAHHARAQRVAIVTDSAADIPEELIDQLGIHVVPLRVHFGNRSYLDKVTLTPAEFYRELASNPQHPKTSQPPPGDFRRIYEFLASHYENVVSISVSAKVSGTYNAAVGAAQRIARSASGGQVVHVIDSGSVSCGQGLVAIAAAECALAGGSVDEVIGAARAARERTAAFALLTQLDYAVRGGRVPPIARRIAHLLRLSVVLESRADGEVKPAGMLLGREGMESAFARDVLRRASKRGVVVAPAGSPGGPTNEAHYRLLIGHSDAAERAAWLLEATRSRIGPNAVARAWITDMGTVLGTHGGQGVLILGLQREASTPATREAPAGSGR